MFPMQPKKRLNPNMMAESADMAAEQMQINPATQMQQGRPAPVIPTTNMRLPNKPMPAPANPNIGPIGMGGGPTGSMSQYGTQKGNNAPWKNRGAGVVVNPNDPSMTQGSVSAAPSAGSDQIKSGGAIDRAGGSIGGIGVDGQMKSPYAPSTGEGGPKDSSQLLDEAIKSLLGDGPRDTAQEEADIRRQMESDASAGQAELWARIGAGGGGTSGALGALTTDMRSRSALDAANAITGVKDDARDEYLKKLNMGIGAEFTDRSADMDEAQFEMYTEMINQLYGNQTPEPKNKEGIGQSEADNATEATQQPSGSTLAWSASGYNYYRMPNGNLVKVKAKTITGDY